MASSPLYIVRSVPSRMANVETMKGQIDGLHVFLDESGSAMQSFIKALREIGNRPAVILEDDVELTSRFCEKAEAVIGAYPASFITFFNLSKKKLISRWEAGAKFCMGQCFYLPAGYAPKIADFHPSWVRKKEHPTGTDLMMADWLKSRKERYYIHCPSLVQHLPVVSVIDSKRSKYRQSITFET